MSSPADETGKAPGQSDTILPGIASRSRKSSAGLDLQYIKVAVDLQNLSEDGADEKLQASLDSLLKASSVDTAFIALFDDQVTRIDRLIVAKTAFSQSAAEVLNGRELEELSWFRARLKPMRVVELADTAGMASSNADAKPRKLFAGKPPKTGENAGMSSPADETGKAPGQSDTILPGIASRSRKSSAGLDLQYIKVAVDLQNLSEDGADEKLQASLDSLLKASSVDTAFIALFDDQVTRIDRLIVAKTAFSQSAAEVLNGRELEELSWFRARLKPMRVVELADTAGMASSNADAAFLAKRHIGSILVIGFSLGNRMAGMLGFCMDAAKPEGWDVEYHLLLKLIGTSLACGLERLSLSHRLANIDELRQVYDVCANDGIWDYDPSTRRLVFSPRWKTMLGYAQDELTDSPDWRNLVHPDDLGRVQGEMRAYVDGRADSFESTHRMRHRAGGWRWVYSRVLALRTETGNVRRLIGVELDITQRKTYEEELFREKERAQITLQSIGDGVVTTDENSIVDYLNPIAEDLTGWSLEHAKGKKVDEIFRSFHEETCEPLENPLAMAIKRCRLIKTVRPTLLIRRDGNELYIESTAAPIRNGSGDVSGGVLVFHDVSESRELNRKLSYHASHDILTGLVNRREFENKLERALKAAQSRETSYAMCHLNLDQFKIVNDACGHSAGDALLGQLGALLKSRIRWRDTVARLGGDEFGVLLESCSLDEAMKTAEDLRETVKEFRFVWEDRTFRLGVSIGIVPISSENQDVAALLSAADSACAAAKEAGRNRIHCYQENDIDLMRRRKEMQWAARINNALEENRFELFRQTILPLQDNDTGSHYEILLRMRDENGHIVAPDCSGQRLRGSQGSGAQPNPLLSGKRYRPDASAQGNAMGRAHQQCTGRKSFRIVPPDDPAVAGQRHRLALRNPVAHAR